MLRNSPRTTQQPHGISNVLITKSCAAPCREHVIALRLDNESVREPIYRIVRLSRRSKYRKQHIQQARRAETVQLWCDPTTASGWLAVWRSNTAEYSATRQLTLRCSITAEQPNLECFRIPADPTTTTAPETVRPDPSIRRLHYS